MAKMSTNEMVNELGRLIKMYESLKGAKDILDAVHEAEKLKKSLQHEIEILELEKMKLDEMNEASYQKVRANEEAISAAEARAKQVYEEAVKKAEQTLANAKSSASLIITQAENIVASMQHDTKRAADEKAEAFNSLNDAKRELAAFKSAAEAEKERIRKALGI